MSEITLILRRAQAGDARAAADLLPLVYDELRRLAAHRLAAERRQHTLQPTALVHEAWLKIAGADDRVWGGRQHFFAAAAEAMRRILVDRARRRLAAKRGSGAVPLDVDELEIAAPPPNERLLAVNEALEKFAAVAPRKAELVKLRYVVGMSFDEAATARHRRAHGQAMVGLRPRLALGRAPRALRRQATRPSSGLATPGNMRVPGTPGLRLDMSEPGARRRSGYADEMVASRTLNLPARVAGVALQRLVAVGTAEFEFVHHPFMRNPTAKGMRKSLHTFPADIAHLGSDGQTPNIHGSVFRPGRGAVPRCR